MPNQRYQPEDRLRSKADYERVLARQCKARGKYLLVFGCENTLGRPRLGRIVSKRWGNAVVRNRYRRWIREVFRKIKSELPAIDIVVMPVQTIVRLTDVQAELLPLAKKDHAILSANVSGSFHQ
jgi:ribonuclease P protein component